MTEREILVLQKRVKCFSCGDEFDGFTEVPDEGFGYAAQLYECGECHSVFFHNLEDAWYRGPVEKQIQKLSCPKCERLLSATLKKRDFVGRCPTCGKRDYNGTDESREVHIRAISLYD
jgi:Zn finger protein HypA/HybF involved in hydrogenase expression